MRQKTFNLAEAGSTVWLPLDTKLTNFQAALGVSLSNGATLTYTVQHTLSDLGNNQDCTISQSTTVATVTLNDHGLVVGDSVVVDKIINNTNLSGTRAVASVIDANQFTYTADNSATVAATDTKLVALNVFPHATLVNNTASADGNYLFPVSATRLTITAYTDGSARFEVINS